MKSPNFEVGERVAYSAEWLRNTGQVASADDIGHWKGKIVEIKPLGTDIILATVLWDHGDSMKVNVKNLAKVGPNSRYCAV